MKKILQKFYSSARSAQKAAKAGFTMVEMLVVLAIFGILTAVIIFNHGSFNSNIVLTNMAYEVALEIRQAQVYSLGVRSGSIDGESNREDFDINFGVWFNLEDIQPRDKFMFYADVDDAGDRIAKCQNGDEPGNPSCTVNTCTVSHPECRSVISLSRNISFGDYVCVSPEGIDPVDTTTGDCSDPDYEESNASIIFKRPNPEALIKTDDNADFDVEELIDPDNAMNVGIILENTLGSRRAVIVRSTGQITVEEIINN